MKNSRSLNIAELQQVFYNLSKETILQHEKDIDMYLSRGADVEKQTLIANIWRKVTRPHTSDRIGFTATITFKIRGKAYKSEPYDDEYLLTHNGYTYYYAGIECFVEAIDIEGYAINVSLPKFNDYKSPIQNYKDLDNYPYTIHASFYINVKEETDLTKRIYPSEVLLHNSINYRDSIVDVINDKIKFILKRTDEYKKQFVDQCLADIAAYKKNMKTTAVSEVPKFLTKSQVRKYGVEKAINNYLNNEKKANDEAQICIDQLNCVINIIEKTEGDTFNSILDYHPIYNRNFNKMKI